jgi:hypothetical protein
MKAKSFTLTILTFIFHGGETFMNPSTIHSSRHFQSTKVNTKSWTESTGLSTSSTASSRPMMMLPFSELTTTMESLSIGTSGMLISSDQDFEAQIFGDLAHLILDFATICSPDTILLRLLVFLGRICSIMSDYTPDHQITYDELVFQSSMLVISTKMFLEKFTTMISSVNEVTSFKDRRIYKSIFDPAGFTWIQYKSLLALGVVEWSHYKPGTLLFEDSDSLLITYKSEIHQLVEGSPSKQYGICKGKFCHDIIADFSQVHDFLETKRNKSSKQQPHHDDLTDARILLQVGKTGATLLRIDTKKLLEHTGEDAAIAERTKNLYFNAMQKMLTSYSEFPLLKGNGTESHPRFVL